MVPKLVAEDIPLLFSLLSDVFPKVGYTQAEMKGLKDEDGEGKSNAFVLKAQTCPN